MPRLSPTYGLNGDAETRIEREFENVYKVKSEAALTKYQSQPNVQTMPQAQPVLVKDGGKWYIRIRIDDKIFTTAELTEV
jgi:hypothetical protein